MHASTFYSLIDSRRPGRPKPVSQEDSLQ